MKLIQIASDAEDSYVKSIVTEAKRHNVSVVFSDTMQELAAKHGIDVPCGAVGFFKD